MRENRKAIILEEIIYWKKNKLLPAHYCDFLLALYTEGNSRAYKKNRTESEINLKTIILLFFGLMLLPLPVFLTFLEIHVIFQLLVLLISLLYGYLIFYQIEWKNRMVSLLIHVIWLSMWFNLLYFFMVWLENDQSFIISGSTIFALLITIIGISKKRKPLAYIGAVVTFLLMTVRFF